MATEAEYRAVVNEFREVLNDLAGTHAMALMGVMRQREWVENNPPPDLGPDSTLSIGHGDPNTPDGFSYQRWPWLSLLDRLDPEGPVVRDLGQQWVVMVAAQWNDNFRERIGHVTDKAKNEVQDPCFADINRMRNDIIHHRGIASERKTGRCEVFKWFEVGQAIHPMPVHIAELASYMGDIQASSDYGPEPWKETDSI